MKFHPLWAAFTILAALLSCVAPTDADEHLFGPARREKDGTLIHVVESTYQSAPTEIRVLLPDAFDKAQRYPVVYVLPVEAAREAKFGDGLIEIQKHHLHNKRPAIFVAPTFSTLPWYADHATKEMIRQESYFLKVVVPFVDKHYPTLDKPDGRLLLGFSKSGWGAWSLLLRHPDTFGKAVAWDAPLMMDRLGKYGSAEIFGDQANFERYRLADLLAAKSKALGGTNRLLFTGYGNFRDHHVCVRELLERLEIPHIYRDGPERKHDWHSGWVEEAVGLLLEPTIK